MALSTSWREAGRGSRGIYPKVAVTLFIAVLLVLPSSGASFASCPFMTHNVQNSHFTNNSWLTIVHGNYGVGYSSIRRNTGSTVFAATVTTCRGLDCPTNLSKVGIQSGVWYQATGKFLLVRRLYAAECG